MKPSMTLGEWRPLMERRAAPDFELPAHHLVTHGVVLGMTGSGKTGFVTVLIEEAARGRAHLVIDVKGDLPNSSCSRSPTSTLSTSSPGRSRSGSDDP